MLSSSEERRKARSKRRRDPHPAHTQQPTETGAAEPTCPDVTLAHVGGRDAGEGRTRPASPCPDPARRPPGSVRGAGHQVGEPTGPLRSRETPEGKEPRRARMQGTGPSSSHTMPRTRDRLHWRWLTLGKCPLLSMNTFPFLCFITSLAG